MPGRYTNFFSLPEEADELRWENTSDEYLRNEFARRNLESLSRARWNWLDTTRFEDLEVPASSEDTEEDSVRWESLSHNGGDQTPTNLLRVIRQPMPEPISNRLFSETSMEFPRDDFSWTNNWTISFEVPKKKIRQMEVE